MDHFFSVNRVHLAEDGGNLTNVEVLRAGVIQDRGLKISQKMLTQFVQNFKDNVYGTELQVNLNHDSGSEAAGWIKDLFLDPEDETRLMAAIEWTKLGVEKIADKLFKFVSAEFSTKYPHHKTGKLTDNVFSGLALTNTPALKGQSPIALSEDIDFTNKNDDMTFKSLVTKLSERAVVSKEDKVTLRELLEELPEAEQAEHTEAVAAVEAKPEAPEQTAEEKAAAEAAATKAAEEKAAAEKVAADAKAAEEAAKTDAEKLSEKLEETTQKLEELKEWKETQELSEVFEKKIVLSNSHTTGLTKEMQPSVVSFMRKLSEEERAEFLTIIGSVKTVSLEELGSTDAEDATTQEVGAVKPTDLAEAEKMHKEDDTKSVSEHLSEIYRIRREKATK